jgi:prepilin-type N-terminal cleavage/methylation domain-containing protein
MKRTRRVVERNKIKEYSAFSLIELSIVLIIMGLLVAGVTGGASMIENAKITSLKREVDDHIRDVFTFYSRTGRLPGDPDGSGQIGWRYVGTYPANSFPYPYNFGGINKVSAPFIELYLYGISSFKPDFGKGGITHVISSSDNRDVIRNIASKDGIPTSKIYKNIAFTHRTEGFVSNCNNDSCLLFGVESGTKAISMFLSEDNKSVNIAKKIDLKFDDGTYNGGNIRGYCNNLLTQTYSSADFCGEVIFYLEIK